MNNKLVLGALIALIVIASLIVMNEIYTYWRSEQTATPPREPVFCRFVPDSEFEKASPSGKYSKVVNETIIVGDGVVEVVAPLNISGTSFYIRVRNADNKTPIVLILDETFAEVINISYNGHSIVLNHREILSPTYTRIPLPPECNGRNPAGSFIVDISDILYPGSIKRLSVPVIIPLYNIEGSGNITSGYVYVKVRIAYASIKEIYRIETNSRYWSAREAENRLRAVSIYKEEYFEAVFKIYFTKT